MAEVIVFAPKKRKLQVENLPYHWCHSQADIVAKQYEAMKAGLYTDFTIHTKDGGKFDVHRLCLARIPYFHDMFNNPMKESIQKSSHEDICTDVLSVILEYIYTGMSENIGNYVEELILCADKYRMDGLVERCALIMMENLCVENAARYLSCVNAIGLDKMRKPILQYIERNIEQVMKSKDWPIIVEDFAAMTEILKEIATVRSVSGSTWGTLSVFEDSGRCIKWVIPRVSRPKLRFHCYYEFQSPQFTITDSFGLIYLARIKYHAKPEGCATIIVFLSSNKTEFGVRSQTLQPPRLQCKWKVPTDNLLSWQSGTWRYITDTPEDHIWIFIMKPRFPINNPFMINQEFLLSMIDTNIRYDVLTTNDFGKQYPSTPVPSEFETSGPRIVDSKRCDTDILVGGERFRVHKSILIAKSRKFAALLSSSMPQYELGDINPEVFHGILNIMSETNTYPAQVYDQLELLRAAKKYIDDRHITYFENFLVDKLNPQNAIDFLLCAKEVKSKKLRLSAMRFITRNAEAVMASKSWTKMQQYKSLVAIMIKIISAETESPIKEAPENQLVWSKY
ncbi:hypothetical protein GE061_006351 [Apolygus lucorum]|uniref:BTB domain-containing protein n=1 Tax=Apolygus lucorum TaxID=248454 RepID=A0A8S9WVD3_APOLU|nr:hypothetical protein GE061_006351 [Apolygus lucorum]